MEHGKLRPEHRCKLACALAAQGVILLCALLWVRDGSMTFFSVLAFACAGVSIWPEVRHFLRRFSEKYPRRYDLWRRECFCRTGKGNGLLLGGPCPVPEDQELRALWAGMESVEIYSKYVTAACLVCAVLIVLTSRP